MVLRSGGWTGMPLVQILLDVINVSWLDGNATGLIWLDGINVSWLDGNATGSNLVGWY